MTTEQGAESASGRVVFLLDVDNTLLDNDRLKADLALRLDKQVGSTRAGRFWDLYEDVRREEDVVDFPETLRRWRTEAGNQALADRVQDLLNDIPFKEYLYPHVLDTLRYLWSLGTVAILSDGDQTFQPMKIRNSGLEHAVHGNVLIYVHKELELPKVFDLLPARHYVVVDDKPRILAALEKHCPTTFTTFFVLQGKYAVEGEFRPAPDYVIEHVADLRHFTRQQFEDRRAPVASSVSRDTLHAACQSDDGPDPTASDTQKPERQG